MATAWTVAGMRSESAEQKARTQKTPDGLPVMSFSTLMQHLAPQKRHIIEPKVPMKEPCTFTKLGDSAPIQIQAFELLGVKVRSHLQTPVRNAVGGLQAGLSPAQLLKTDYSLECSFRAAGAGMNPAR